MASSGGERSIGVRFELDLHDGKGPRKGGAELGQLLTRGGTTWAMTVNASSVPIQYWEQEQPLMSAILHTYSQDAGVIGRENGVVLQGIKAAGDRAHQQALDADDRRIASSQHFNQQMNDIDINSKAMQNYTLDRSQLSAVGSNGVTYHGTVNNTTAAGLVAAYPNTFQYAPQSSWVKGIDY